MNQDIVDILNKHLKQNHKVIMVTASFDLYTKRIAEKLGIKHVISTISEVKDGIITGRISGINCHGQEKVKRLKDYLNQSEWENFICYTDHYSDLPLLERAHKGYLVNPGLKSRNILKNYDFFILN